MEPSGRNPGNQWQMGELRKWLEQAKTVATGCDRLPIGAHGKEGVDGSSPSEGLALWLASRLRRPSTRALSSSQGQIWVRFRLRMLRVSGGAHADRK